MGWKYGDEAKGVRCMKLEIQKIQQAEEEVKLRFKGSYIVLTEADVTQFKQTLENVFKKYAL